MSHVKLMSDQQGRGHCGLGNGQVGLWLGTVTLPPWHNTDVVFTPRPPLSAKNKWHLFRVSPENRKVYQTFPSGKRVSYQERQRRDAYFEFRS